MLEFDYMLFVRNNIVALLVLIAPALIASNLDSLDNLLQYERQQSNQQREVELLILIGKTQLSQDNLKEALSVFEDALPKAKKINDWKNYQAILNNKADVYLEMNQFPQAIETLTKLIDDIKSSEVGNLAKAYSDLAEAYRRIGYNELAYEYHLSGLHIYEEEKDTVSIARSLYNIGSIFFYQDNYELALEYYQKTLDICNAAKLERHIFSCLSAIGGAYNRIYQTEKSLKYNQQAYELGKQLGLKSGLAYAVMNLGANYAVMGDTLKALAFYDEALVLNQESDDKWGECGTLRTIGETLMHLGEYEECFGYLKESLDIAEQMGFRPRLVELHRTIAFYYEKIGDYKLTSKYLEKYALLKDSLSNEATLQKMSDSKSRYEIIQKEKALALKDAEFATQQRTYLLIGIGVLSICLWLLFKQNRLIAKNNFTLEEKNKQIKEQNEELVEAYSVQKETNEKIKEQNRLLEQSNTELKSFAFIASHDLKEPLRGIGSYANLLQRRYKGKLDSDADEFLEFITSNAKRLYALLNDVLQFSKIDFDRRESGLTDTNEAVKIVHENLKNKINQANAKISIGNLPKITADQFHLVQLFQNLIDNSIKYSDTMNPLIEITSNRKDGYYEFSVKDNGIGIEPEYQQKVFEMFKRLHNREKYDGSGVGLAICKKIVQQYGGEIWVEPNADKGSTFYFTLPATNPENKD